ncbi:heavy metal translocating P-type ATPase [Ostreiculturibacter nitratireducens]|uniref:heavy metal translocating P-type ATPase n=1 Tax=Ostreiculturibacter nitratireducens TaxID=3075226 RepID=UPI0031B5955F
MTATFTPSASACPACDAAPTALEVAAAARKAEEGERILLSVPAAHCAACISTLEKGLEAVPGVRSARVNLTLKRVSVAADPGVTAEKLIPEVRLLGYEAHELDAGMLSATDGDPASRDLLMRLAVAGFAMMNIMLLSVAVWSGAEAATRDLFHWISAAIALPTIVFSGQPFFRSAWSALRVGRTNMDVPISLGMILATGTSLFETMQSGEHAYFDAAVSLTFFLLIGRYLDQRSRAAARSAARELAALEVPRAMRIGAAGEEIVPVAELRAGDLVKILPGVRVPADGIVETGESEIDRSLLTGESLPVFAGPGAELATGEVNLTGPLTLRVTAAGKDSSLHRLADLVAVAEAGRGRYTSIADRVVRYYTPTVHAVAFLTFVGWFWIAGDARLSLNIAAAVLIVTCPCALGLAVPAVMTAASGRLFRKGLLIKDGTALERLAEVDTVVFDKTGTLTLGKPEAMNLDAHSARAVQVAAALAAASSHPLAQALAEAARAAGVSPAPVKELREVPGYGVEGRLGAETVRLGRAAWVGAEPGETTAAWLRVGAGQPVEFTFADRLRPDAEPMIAALKSKGLQVHLLSGDAEPPVAALAERLGIANWISGALPEDKAAFVARLKAEGRRVLMVGDGLNDTAALAGAHVSVSPASALDAARTASDIVMLGASLAPVAEAAGVARSAIARIRENIVISNIYNLVAVPLAVLGYCTPLFAALAMSSSSITVTLNALRVRR